MLAIKNGRERPWLNALDVKEYFLAEWGELGNPPKGFDYYPGPQVLFSETGKKKECYVTGIDQSLREN